MHLESAETLLKRYAKRNFWLNVLDGVAFVFGISMVSRYTVLPLFVSRLSGERWLQGLIPALTQDVDRKHRQVRRCHLQHRCLAIGLEARTKIDLRNLACLGVNC